MHPNKYFTYLSEHAEHAAIVLYSEGQHLKSSILARYRYIKIKSSGSYCIIIIGVINICVVSCSKN